MSGRIIIMNGTSSAGKSTLAKALRERLAQPFCYYASDQLADAGFRPLIREETWDTDAIDRRNQFFDGFHRSIPAFAAAGNNLIVEHIIEEQQWANDLIALLRPFDVFWVGVHAPIEELEKRERERGDRQLGEALFHLKTHSFCRYDLEVDSTRSTATIITEIEKAWNARSKN